MIPVTDEDMKVPYPQYHCPICGEELPLTEARVTVTCASHLPQNKTDFTVRDAGPGDLRDIEDICDKSWGETDIDAFGKSFDVLAGDNLIAESEGHMVGLLSLVVDEGELAIVLLSVYPEFQGAGVGRALIKEAERFAVERGLPFMKVAAGNDDIPSVYFYMRQGFVIADVVIGAIADDLGMAPPGFAGIPIRDEVRLRKPVCIC